MSDTDKETDALDPFFAAARQSADFPPDLKARMQADAIRIMAAPAGPPAFWSQVRGLFGGWRGMGGLVAACAVGLWIGLAPPTDWADPMQVVTRSQSGWDVLAGDTLVLAMTDEED